MPSSQPNILVLMTDQQRLDTISAYGLNDICRTPNVDGLAERGVLFDHAFTPTAICSPARASFYTGLYPHHHGVTANGLTIRDMAGIPTPDGLDGQSLLNAMLGDTTSNGREEIYCVFDTTADENVATAPCQAWGRLCPRETCPRERGERGVQRANVQRFSKEGLSLNGEYSR